MAAELFFLLWTASELLRFARTDLGSLDWMVLSIALIGWYGAATGVATFVVLTPLGGSLYVALGRARASERTSRTSKTRV